MGCGCSKSQYRSNYINIGVSVLRVQLQSLFGPCIGVFVTMFYPPAPKLLVSRNSVGFVCFVVLACDAKVGASPGVFMQQGLSVF